MNYQNIRAVDHARAAAIAMAVMTDDDAMAAVAINDINGDPEEQAAVNVFIAMGINLHQFLKATIGQDAAEQLLQKTLVQLRAAADNQGSKP